MVLLVIKLLNIKRFMYILAHMYILAEICAYHLQLKCMSGHFFSGPSLHTDLLYSLI